MANEKDYMSPADVSESGELLNELEDSDEKKFRKKWKTFKKSKRKCKKKSKKTCKRKSKRKSQRKSKWKSKRKILWKCMRKYVRKCMRRPTIRPRDPGFIPNRFPNR